MTRYSKGSAVFASCLWLLCVESSGAYTLPINVNDPSKRHDTSLGVASQDHSSQQEQQQQQQQKRSVKSNDSGFSLPKFIQNNFREMFPIIRRKDKRIGVEVLETDEQQGDEEQLLVADLHMDHIIPEKLAPSIAEHRREKLGISFEMMNDVKKEEFETKPIAAHGSMKKTSNTAMNLDANIASTTTLQAMSTTSSITSAATAKEKERLENYSSFQDLVPGISDYERILQAQLLLARGMPPPLVALYVRDIDFYP